MQFTSPRGIVQGDTPKFSVSSNNAVQPKTWGLTETATDGDLRIPTTTALLSPTLSIIPSPPSSLPTATPSTLSSSQPLSLGAKIGISLGSVFCALLLLILAVLIARKKQTQRQQDRLPELGLGPEEEEPPERGNTRRGTNEEAPCHEMEEEGPLFRELPGDSGI